MSVGFVCVEDVVLAYPDLEAAGRDVLDAVGGRDHPAVRQQGRPALVLELTALVLSQ